LQRLQVRPYRNEVIDVTPVPATATGRRDRKKQQTRAALIAAALRLVDERGLDGVTVEDISAAVDVSPRTFFNYFATKDEAITGDQFVDSTGVRDRFLAAPAAVPVLDALLRALGPALARMEGEREIWLLRMRVMARNPSLIAGLLARGARAERDLVTAIAERVGVPPHDAYPAVTAAATGAAVRAAMERWAAGDGTRPLTDLVGEAFALLSAGLAAPTADPLPAACSLPTKAGPLPTTAGPLPTTAGSLPTTAGSLPAKEA
jgi:AcrR family transcriptional regulator